MKDESCIIDGEKDKPVKVIQISEETLRNIIQESCQEFMSTMGVTWKDPQEMQRDFAHLREWRETTESIKRKTFGAVVVIIVSGLASMVVMGVKQFFHGN